MEIVFLVYGAAFILLGTAILVQPKRGSSFALSRALWLLAAFALLHGINEWVDMWKLIRGANHALNAAALAFLLTSFGFLFEFGRRVIVMANPAMANILRRFLGWPVYALLVVGIALGSFAGDNFLQDVSMWSRYLLGFPGALLSGFGLVSYYRLETLRLQKLGVETYFMLAGVAFVVYGVLSGLVVPVADFFPANWLNYDSFRAATLMPVQMFRAICAVVAAFAMAKILFIFHWEAHQQLEEALGNARASAARFKDLVEFTSDWVWEVDVRGVYTYASPKIQEILGYAPEEIVGRTPFDLMPPGEAERIRAVFESVVASRQPCYSIENTNRHKNGHLVVLETNAVPVFSSAGELVGYRGMDRDITARKQAELKLRQAAKVFESTSEGVIITASDHRIQAVNQAFTRITGYSESEVVGKKPSILQSGRHNKDYYLGIWEALRTEGRWQGEIWNRRKDGAIYPEWLNISEVRDEDGAIVNYIGVFADITSVKDAQHRFEYAAHHDALTGLPNRVLFRDRLEQVLARALRYDEGAALLFVDIDRFKAVNDTLGHEAGDLLLKEVARRLLGCLRAEDTVARMGGDEFLVIQQGVAHTSEPGLLATRLLAQVSQPLALAGHTMVVGASIGISLYPQDGTDIGTLLRNADAAMYRAKEQGRNCFQYYSNEMTVADLERLDLESDLRLALEHGEFLLHYQPQVDLRSGQIIGAEALIRWQHPVRGLISPGVFIPLAEDIGLIGPIGEWVLRTACIEATSWQVHGMACVRVAVNVSGRQISNDHVLEKVVDALSVSGLQPQCLEVEVTESVVMQDATRAISTLNALKDLGIALSIDDFGTGYSSLAYLKRFPIDKLKIDKSFVDGLPENQDDAAIADAIIAMSHSLKLTVIAEGVETEAQLEFLRTHGCDEMQGYLFSRPLPAKQFVELLKNGRSRATATT